MQKIYNTPVLHPIFLKVPTFPPLGSRHYTTTFIDWAHFTKTSFLKKKKKKEHFWNKGPKFGYFAKPLDLLDK